MSRVAIVGLGLIGSSAALAFRGRGWDRDPAARRAARSAGIDAAETLAEALEHAEVALLAVPSGEVPEALLEAARIAPRALLTDAASWKRPAIEAAARLPETARYVAGHPMAGGVAPRADLFSGRPWLLVPTARSDEASIRDLSARVRAIGAIPRVVDADVHDSAMTWVSHLPLAVASSLARAAARGSGAEAGALAGPGLSDTTRLAETPRALALELALADPRRLADALDAVSTEARSLAEALRSGDSAAVGRFFEEAAAAKRTL